MKQIVFGNIVLLFALTLSLFASCGSDDEDNSSDPSKNNKRISKITEETQDAIRDCVFQYDSQGRVIEMTMTTNSLNTTDIYSITYQYGESLIIKKEDVSGNKNIDPHYPYPRTHSYALSNGLIVKQTDTNQNGFYRNISFSYDSEGYMESISDYYDTYSDDVKHHNLIWEDGNLMLAQWMGIELKLWEYSNLLWKAGTFFDLFTSLVPNTDPILFSIGYFGKLPKNLPIKSDSYSYDFEMSDGYITKVKKVYRDYINDKILETRLIIITWE